MAYALNPSSSQSIPQSPFLLTSSQTNPIFPLPSGSSLVGDPPPTPNPPPDPPPHPQASSSLPLPKARWSSLFASKPRSAGDFMPPPITLKYSGKSLIPSDDIIQASVEVWQEYITGFFLDSPLSYTAVVSRLKNLWKPRGSIKVKSNGSMFFFLLSDAEDRKRILEADPVVIRNKVFILKKWDVNMGTTGGGIKKVPVWVKLYNLPMVAWSRVGVCWLASHIGDFLCMDRATESLEWLGYAKVMVEISPESELPESISVILPDGTEHFISVSYYWKPDICRSCFSFGHTETKCLVGGTVISKESDKKGSDQVISRVPGVAVGHNAMLSNQPKVKHCSNLVKPSANPTVSQDWKMVEGKKSNKAKAVAYSEAAVVQTGNRYETLGNQSNATVEQPDLFEIEEGEICEPAKVSNMENSNEEGTLSITDISSNKTKIGMQVPTAQSSVVCTKEQHMKPLTRVDSISDNVVINGDLDANVPLINPTEHMTTEFNFRPGFLNPVAKRLNVDVNFNPMQQLLENVINYSNQSSYGGNASYPPNLADMANVLEKDIPLCPDTQLIVENLDSFLNKRKEVSVQSETQCDDVETSRDQLNDSRQPENNLDGFLMNNFNHSNSPDVPKTKTPPDKVKVRKVRKDKTIQELIESMRIEIESGGLSEEVCEGKRQVIASMMRNYKDDLSKPCGPYANIPPPPGFKAPPPDDGVDSTAAASTSSTMIKPGKSSVTRSMVRAMKNAIYDNG